MNYLNNQDEIVFYKGFRLWACAMVFPILLISDSPFRLAIYLPNSGGIDSVLIISFLLFSILFSILFLKKHTWIADRITVALSLRLLFSLLTIIAFSTSIYSSVSSIFTLLVGVLAYTFFRNTGSRIKGEEFADFISLYLIIISLQMTSIFLENPLTLKGGVEIPLGASNYIATHIVVCVIFLLFIKQKSIFQSIATFLGLISLILTFSFGAIIAFIIILFINLLFTMNISVIKRVSLVFMFFTLAFGAVQFYENYEYTEPSLLSNFNNMVSIKVKQIKYGGVEAASAGRFELYANSWEEFKENPIFGSGGGVEFDGEDNFKTHNLFLEALVSYGIIGLAIFTTSLLLLYRNTIGYMNDPFVKAGVMAISVAIIHGMVEPNFFTLKFEFLFWSIAGFTVARATRIKLLYANPMKEKKITAS